MPVPAAAAAVVLLVHPATLPIVIQVIQTGVEVIKIIPQAIETTDAVLTFFFDPTGRLYGPPPGAAVRRKAGLRSTYKTVRVHRRRIAQR